MFQGFKPLILWQFVMALFNGKWIQESIYKYFKIAEAVTIYGTSGKGKVIWKVLTTNLFHNLERVKSQTHSLTHSLTHLVTQQTFLASHRRPCFIWVSTEGQQEFTMDKGAPLRFKRWHDMV